METNFRRKRSQEFLESYGIAVSDSLPELDVASVRPKNEILDRAMCLHATGAVAHGFDSERAVGWLSENELWDKCTEREVQFLSGANDSNSMEMRSRVEALWALFWTINDTVKLLPISHCSDSFAAMLPDLRIQESPKRWFNMANLKSNDTIISTFDVYYCLNWALDDSTTLPSTRMRLVDLDYVIRQRRYALDWVTGDIGWEEISVDT